MKNGDIVAGKVNAMSIKGASSAGRGKREAVKQKEYAKQGGLWDTEKPRNKKRETQMNAVQVHYEKLRQADRRTRAQPV